MNENRFISQRTHTRVKFQPLTTTCELSCLTPASPAAQTVDTTSGSPSYEPNRTLTPTAIYPFVRAMDPDNVFHHGPANQYLATIQWYVNNVPIEEVWTVDTDYTIDTSDSDVRGTLYVKKNLAAGNDVVLTFRGTFLDWRTGIVYNAESSNEIALTTTEKTDDHYGCSVDKALITYDPLYDDLLRYDYMVGRGIPVSGTRDSHKDGHSFEQTVKVLLTTGLTEITTLPQDITMRVVNLGSNTPLVPNSAASPELMQASYPNIKFDMRMIDKKDYEVQFVKDDVIIARESIGLCTKVTMPHDGKGLRAADIAVSQEVYENAVLLNLKDRTVDYPELYYLIVWYTQAKVNQSGSWVPAEAKMWQRGEHLAVAVRDLGIGLTKNDSYFDYWFEVDPHKTCELILDDNNQPILDDDGTFLIG